MFNKFFVWFGVSVVFAVGCVWFALFVHRLNDERRIVRNYGKAYVDLLKSHGVR